MKEFVGTFSPTQETKILDVGGTTYNWKLIDCQSQITILNLSVPQDIDAQPRNFIFVKGNGLSLQYHDGSFDICYSNSVIEHVGTFENQFKFASELIRVGRQVWVQTPAYSFFFEPHLLTPFIHFFPKEYQRKLLRNFTVWGWLVRPNQQNVDNFLSEIRLITYKEMGELFPSCEIRIEKFLGFPKAYIAVKK
jgi:hypothetical protein